MKQSVKTAVSVQRERSKIMYKINPSSYSSVFVIPTEIADKHLRMAGKAQLKVLLWLYRNPMAPFDLAVVSRETGIPTDEIDDAMLYWIQAGLVSKDGESSPVVPVQTAPVQTVAEHKPAAFNTPAAPVQKKEEKPQEEPVYIKPSVRDVARRLGESPEIAELFNEVQEVFGRTLGQDAQGNLLMLHDHYGLSPEAIVMLCSYAKTVGKQGALAYIMQMGKGWADEGILDFESASRKIARLETTHGVWDEFRVLTGIENPRPTAKQSEMLEIWTNDYGFGVDIIYYAYEKTVEKKGKISYGYMNGILRSWFESGYKTIAQIERAATEFAQGVAEKQAAKIKEQPVSGQNPSYDIELAMKRSLALDPAKTKRGK